MAWGYYLNMEELSAEIVEEALSKMTNSNDQEIDNFIKTDNGEEFIANLKWGTTAVVMICCYVESSINTLLRDFLGYSPDGEVIKSSIDTKLEVIFSNQPDQLRLIKGDNCWDKFKRAVSVRNHLVHYKNNSASMCSSWPLIDSWKIGREILGDYFTKDGLRVTFAESKRLVGLIADALNLSVNPDCHVLGCDARFGAPSYFCTRDLKETILSELEKERQQNDQAGFSNIG